MSARKILNARRASRAHSQLGDSAPAAAERLVRRNPAQTSCPPLSEVVLDRVTAPMILGSSARGHRPPGGFRCTCPPSPIENGGGLTDRPRRGEAHPPPVAPEAGASPNLARRCSSGPGRRGNSGSIGLPGARSVFASGNGTEMDRAVGRVTAAQGCALRRLSIGAGWFCRLGTVSLPGWRALQAGPAGASAPPCGARPRGSSSVAAPQTGRGRNRRCELRRASCGRFRRFGDETHV